MATDHQSRLCAFQNKQFKCVCKRVANEVKKPKTCDTCGQELKGQYCEFCLNSGDNGAWIDKIIEQAKDPRHDQAAFKDKKKKHDSRDT